VRAEMGAPSSQQPDLLDCGRFEMAAEDYGRGAGRGEIIIEGVKLVWMTDAARFGAWAGPGNKSG
jgi:hypothetical protein